jgi:rhodanese-related sulfurtransferase
MFNQTDLRTDKDIVGTDHMQSAGYDIDVHTLAVMRADGVAHTVLDIREQVELAICTIQDSLSIPMQQVPHSIETLPRQNPLIVLCHHGMRSAMVTEFLRDNGFDNAWNLAGGIDAWSRLVESGMPRY